jgi:hypothetical protein
MIITLGDVKIEVTRTKRQDHGKMARRVHQMNAAAKAAWDARRAHEDAARNYVVGLI